MKTLLLYLELMKPRLVLLAVAMAAVGYASGLEGELSPFHLFVTLCSLFLLGGAANAFNQHAEQEIDGIMERTKNRPLPSGKLLPSNVLVFAAILAVFSEMILLVLVNPITSVLGATILLLYLGVYTPAKRTTYLSTLVGAIPGALPPLLGYTASAGRVGPLGVLLFLILFLWQIPHFFAIAWCHEEDFRRVRLPLFPLLDPQGASAENILYAVALLPLSLVPSAWGLTGSIYFFGMLIVGITFILFTVKLAITRTKSCARQLFYVSLFYLPFFGCLLLFDKVA